MSSVDDRIVNMQFNNKQFNSSAKDSENALNSLEGTIAKMGKSSGLGDLANNVEKASGKFSAMKIAGVTAIATITNKAVNAGLSLLKNLTIAPIMDGFKEYQTNLNSIQTIMSNTGKSVSVVTKYLNQLNHYSDLTIYNFSEMARNIGTFSAAGVGLKDSVSAIKGIANIAALSGSSSQQASTAMYQLSQAIAAGRVNLQDWNSVVNAGMGGKKLQNALAQTAQAMGVLNKGAITTSGHMKTLKINGEAFRTSISASGAGKTTWLTSDVLVGTLAAMDGRFSHAALSVKGLNEAEIQASIAQARHNLEVKNGIKYTDAQFKEIKKMSDAAYKAATQVKTLPQLMQVISESVGSLWSGIFAAIFGNFKQSVALMTSISSVITTQISRLNRFLVGPKGILTIFNKQGRPAFLEGLFNLSRPLVGIFKALARAWKEVFPSDGGKGLVAAAKGFASFTKIFRMSRGQIEKLRDIFAGFFAVLHIGITVIKGVLSGIFAFFGAIGGGSKKTTFGILGIISAFGRFLVTIDKTVTSGGKIQEFFTGIGKAAGLIVRPLFQVIGAFTQGLSSLLAGDGLKSLLKTGDIFGYLGNVVTSAGHKIQEFLGKLSGMGGVVGKVAGVLQPLVGHLEAFGKNFSGIGKKLETFGEKAYSIGSNIVAGILKGLVGADMFGRIKAWAGGIIDSIKEKLGIHSPATTMFTVGYNIVAGIAQGLVMGVGALAKGINTVLHNLFAGFNAQDFAVFFTTLMAGGMFNAIRNFTNLFVDIQRALTGTLGSIEKAFGATTETLSQMQQAVKYWAIKQIAIAVALLVGALLVLSLIKYQALRKGLTAISILIGELVGSMTLLTKGKVKTDIAVVALALIQMAAAIVILTVAVETLGHSKPEVLEKGIGSVALLLGLMVGLGNKIAPVSKEMTLSAASFIAMAWAINLLSFAVRRLGKLDLKTLAKGIGAVAFMMGILVLSMRGLKSMPKETTLAAGAMIAMAIAVNILAKAVGVLGKMTGKQLVKGGIMLGLILGALVIAMKALGAGGPAAAAAGALAAVGMLAVATALAALIPPLFVLSKMNWGTFLKGFAMLALLAIPLTLLGVAAAVAAPGFLGIGAAFLLAGAGAMFFAKAFLTFSKAGVKGVAVMTAAIIAFVGLLPTIARGAVDAVVAFVQAFADAIPRLLEIGWGMVEAILDGIQKHLPSFVTKAMEIIIGFLDAIRKKLPDFIDAASDLIVAFLNGLRKNAPKLINAAGNLMLTLLNGFANWITSHKQQISNTGRNFTEALLTGVWAAAKGVADGIYNKLIKPILDKIASIKNTLAKLNPFSGGDNIDGTKGQQPDFGNGPGVGNVPGASNGGSHPSHGPTQHNHSRSMIDPRQVVPNPDDLNEVARRTGKSAGTTLAKSVAAAIKAAAPTVAAAINTVISSAAGFGANILGHDGEQAVKDVVNKQRAFEKSQNVADIKQAQADLLKQQQKQRNKEAANLRKRAKKLKGAARQKLINEAKQKENLASNAQNAADRAQNAADAAQARIQAAQDFRDADALGRGDIKSASATAEAERSRKLLRKSEQERKMALEIMKTNKKAGQALLKQALSDAQAAGKLAARARADQQSASKYYAKAVQDNVDALKKQQADTELQDKIDKASGAEKAKLLQDRADQEKIDAEKQKKIYLDKINEAEQLRDTNPKAAQAAIDAASAAWDMYRQLAQAAEQDASDALSAIGASSGGPGGNVINPSADILANAASAVDSFTTSMQEAVAAAMADNKTIQYTQNNYSPVSLSPTEVYRQTKTLINSANIRK